MAQDAPSAAELEANTVVQTAFAAAWEDSHADDPFLRHEEGGWIYVHETSGDISVRRMLPGRMSGMDVVAPPVVPECFLVATYHSHPNPTADGWNPEPSAADRDFAFRHGLPCFVISDLGVYVCGEERRIGGLTGPRGYPK